MMASMFWFILLSQLYDEGPMFQTTYMLANNSPLRSRDTIYRKAMEIKQLPGKKNAPLLEIHSCDVE